MAAAQAAQCAAEEAAVALASVDSGSRRLEVMEVEMLLTEASEREADLSAACSAQQAVVEQQELVIGSLKTELQRQLGEGERLVGEREKERQHANDAETELEQALETLQKHKATFAEHGDKVNLTAAVRQLALVLKQLMHGVVAVVLHQWLLQMVEQKAGGQLQQLKGQAEHTEKQLVQQQQEAQGVKWSAAMTQVWRLIKGMLHGAMRVLLHQWRASTAAAALHVAADTCKQEELAQQQQQEVAQASVSVLQCRVEQLETLVQQLEAAAREQKEEAAKEAALSRVKLVLKQLVQGGLGVAVHQWVGRVWGHKQASQEHFRLVREAKLKTAYNAQRDEKRLLESEADRLRQQVGALQQENDSLMGNLEQFKAAEAAEAKTAQAACDLSEQQATEGKKQAALSHLRLVFKALVQGQSGAVLRQWSAALWAHKQARLEQVRKLREEKLMHAYQSQRVEKLTALEEAKEKDKQIETATAAAAAAQEEQQVMQLALDESDMRLKLTKMLNTVIQLHAQKKLALMHGWHVKAAKASLERAMNEKRARNSFAKSPGRTRIREKADKARKTIADNASVGASPEK